MPVHSRGVVETAIALTIALTLMAATGDAPLQVEYDEPLDRTTVLAKANGIDFEFRHGGRLPLRPPGWVQVSAGDPNRTHEADRIRFDLGNHGAVIVERELGLPLDIALADLAIIANSDRASVEFSWKARRGPLKIDLSRANMQPIRAMVEYGTTEERSRPIAFQGNTAFVFDVSKSMEHGFGPAKDWLLRAIGDLAPPPQTFVLLCISDKIVAQSATRGGTFADAPHKERALRIVREAKVGSESSGSLIKAVQVGMNLNALSVALVTDGDMQATELEGLERILRRNQARLYVIFTVDGDGDARRLLKEVAKRTGGAVETVH